MQIKLSRTTILLCLAALGVGVEANAAVCDPSLAPRATGPQVSDTSFSPRVSKPTFDIGEGPNVYLDEAHHNYHTLEGRYASFADVLRKDGFIVSPLREKFNAEALAEVDILVIANALAFEIPSSEFVSKLPIDSAFTRTEIATVERWVTAGGSLFLIADHMPWPGAAQDLAQVFGVHMTNSFATDKTCAEDEYLFERVNGTLKDHPITEGRIDDERIDYVRTFTGQAFWLTQPGEPILRLKPGSVLLLPEVEWQFSVQTPQIPGDGLLQGATLKHGKGRVAVFGEAAMFSAQVSGAERRPMGMNMQGAEQNPQFLFNIIHWLARLIPNE